MPQSSPEEARTVSLGNPGPLKPKKRQPFGRAGSQVTK